MHDALGGVDILRQFDLANRLRRQRRQDEPDAIERVTARRQELSRRPGIAYLVRALTEEPQRSATPMKPRAHAITLGPRGGNGHLGWPRQPSDSGKRISDDQRFDLELTRVGDVR